MGIDEPRGRRGRCPGRSPPPRRSPRARAVTPGQQRGTDPRAPISSMRAPPGRGVGPAQQGGGARKHNARVMFSERGEPEGAARAVGEGPHRRRTPRCTGRDRRPRPIRAPYRTCRASDLRRLRPRRGLPAAAGWGPVAGSGSAAPRRRDDAGERAHGGAALALGEAALAGEAVMQAP